MESHHHKVWDKQFNDACINAWGAIMGARMAGVDIPVLSPDAVTAIEAAFAEVFDAAFALGQYEGGMGG